LLPIHVDGIQIAFGFEPIGVLEGQATLAPELVHTDSFLRLSVAAQDFIKGSPHGSAFYRGRLTILRARYRSG
jgi:hypothetical protein